MTSTRMHDVPIHSAPYRPEAHADLCYCGFEQCERRKIRLEKDAQFVNDTPEWNDLAKKDAEIVIRNGSQKNTHSSISSIKRIVTGDKE